MECGNGDSLAVCGAPDLMPAAVQPLPGAEGVQAVPKLAPEAVRRRQAGAFRLRDNGVSFHWRSVP